MSLINQPHSKTVEMAVLGAVLNYSQAFKLINEMGITAEHFFVNAHRELFLVYTDVEKIEHVLDLNVVDEYLRKNNLMDKVGGASYFYDVIANSATFDSLEYYLNLLLQKSQLRKLNDACQKITNLFNQDFDHNQILDMSEQLILDVTRARKTSNFVSGKDVANEVYLELKEKSEGKRQAHGLDCGFSGMDKILHGFFGGDLIILAARPSVGKTAFALNLALGCLLHQPTCNVAFFSLEMAASQLMMRLFSAKSMIPADKLKTGLNLQVEDWANLNETLEVFRGLNIHIDDSSLSSISDIMSKCRRLKNDSGLDLIIIDYLQLISSSINYDNRQQEVSLISRQLKLLARELNVPIIALSQLSRSVEQRSDKRPMLSDLRESGSLEQDADIVMLLYRESYYDNIENRNQENEIIEVNIAKHRNGAVGQVKLMFNPEINRFYTVTFKDGE